MKVFVFVFILLFTFYFTFADDGYRLWLKYDKITDTQKLQEYQSAIKSVFIQGDSPTSDIIKNELTQALNGLLDTDISSSEILQDKCILAGNFDDIQSLVNINFDDEKNTIGSEGYVILSYKVSEKDIIIITANTQIGVLYGTFHFLRLIQTLQPIDILNIVESPKIKLRVLNHWDNLDRTVERGYAGFSLWDWHKLPDYIHPYYHDYWPLVDYL